MKAGSVLSVVVVVLAGCASMPAQETEHIAPAVGGAATGLLPEFETAPVLCTLTCAQGHAIDFIPFKTGWNDPQKGLDGIVEKMHNDSGGMPRDVILPLLRDTPKYALLFKLVDARVKVYRIGVVVPAGVMVNFGTTGSFRLTLGRKDGTTFEVLDQGVILPRDFNPITEWDDSRQGGARLTSRHCRGRPEGWPIVVYVLMPPAHFGLPVKGIVPTEQMTCAGPAQPDTVSTMRAATRGA